MSLHVASVRYAGGVWPPPSCEPPRGYWTTPSGWSIQETDHLGGEVALGAILQVIAMAGAVFTRQHPRLDLRHIGSDSERIPPLSTPERARQRCRKGLDTRCCVMLTTACSPGRTFRWVGPPPLMNIGPSWPITPRGCRSRRLRFARSCWRRRLCSMGSRHRACDAPSCGTPVHVPLTRLTHSLVRNHRRCWVPRPRMCSHPV